MIRTKIKQLLCRHDYEVIRWCWRYPGIDKIIEVEVECKKCGKRRLIYTKQYGPAFTEGKYDNGD